MSCQIVKARREALSPLSSKTAHVGLWLAKYLFQHDPPKEERRKLFETAVELHRNTESYYRRAFNRRTDLLKSNQRSSFRRETFSTPPYNRVLIGHGDESVLEVGLTLHHTYGVPVIPGTALKGLASHYCDLVWGERSLVPNQKPASGDCLRFREPRSGETGEGLGAVHRVLFGAGGDDGECAGVTFHDAWMTPDSLLANALRFDVLTPHHSDYSGGPGPGFKPPTDFDDPVPVSFLSVAGSFEVVLSVKDTGRNADLWLDLAMRLVESSLSDGGVGAKTAAGYGRLITGPQVVDAKPRFKVGDKVSVKCVEKRVKRRKLKLKFAAEDGFEGLFPSDEPEVEVGDSVEAWIVDPYLSHQGGYRLSLSPPSEKN